MSVSDAGIFADDVAADVRQAYRELLANGKSATQAMRQMLRTFRGEIQDHDDGPVFWLALAGTQWQLGRLEEKAKAKALELIDSGVALERWLERSNGRGAKQRQRALASLRQQLLSPQTQPKTVRPAAKGPIDTFKWPVGDLFAYRLLSGKCIVWLVVDQEGSADRGYMTIFAPLDWIGKEPPSANRLKSLPIFQIENDFGRIAPYLIVICNHGSQMPSRLTPLGVTRPPKKEKALAPLFRGPHISGGYGFANWEPPPHKANRWGLLDEVLKKQLGWQ